MSTEATDLNLSVRDVSTQSRVLLVEDEPTMRLFLDAMLQKRGYAVTPAASVSDAQMHLKSAGCRAFECVVTDYLMPGENGLDLLNWISAQDDCLATVVVTAENERQILAESLRRGACDFLEKPVSAKSLYGAVERAVTSTRHKRRQAGAEAAVREVARVQQMMLDSEASLSHSKPEIDTFFRPKSEVGGDFLSQFSLGPGKHFVLLTDVSGHDLKAAYISAYFQGLVRGMLDSKTPVQRVFESANRFLIEEWNAIAERSKKNGMSASIAAASVLIDIAARQGTVLTSGAPLPAYVAPHGRAQLIGQGGNAPLGWFAENSVEVTQVAIEEGGAFFLWTDGLEAVAEQLQVSAPALGSVLLLAQNKLRPEPDLGQAADDILVTRVALPSAVENAGGFLPLIVDEYHGGQAREIDQLQVAWTRTLLFCLPDLTPETTFNIILATREAVLNALEHGCEGRPDRRGQFVMSFSPGRNMLRVFVDDPGNGHEFNLEQHQLVATEELIDAHRGLVMIHNLASNVQVSRNGASLQMDFLLEQNLDP